MFKLIKMFLSKFCDSTMVRLSTSHRLSPSYSDMPLESVVLSSGNFNGEIFSLVSPTYLEISDSIEALISAMEFSSSLTLSLLSAMDLSLSSTISFKLILVLLIIVVSSFKSSFCFRSDLISSSKSFTFFALDSNSLSSTIRQCFTGSPLTMLFNTLDPFVEEFRNSFNFASCSNSALLLGLNPIPLSSFKLVFLFACGFDGVSSW